MTKLPASNESTEPFLEELEPDEYISAQVGMVPPRPALPPSDGGPSVARTVPHPSNFRVPVLPGIGQPSPPLKATLHGTFSVPVPVPAPFPPAPQIDDPMATPMPETVEGLTPPPTVVVALPPVSMETPPPVVPDEGAAAGDAAMLDALRLPQGFSLADPTPPPVAVVPPAPLRASAPASPARARNEPLPEWATTSVPSAATGKRKVEMTMGTAAAAALLCIGAGALGTALLKPSADPSAATEPAAAASPTAEPAVRGLATAPEPEPAAPTTPPPAPSEPTTAPVAAGDPLAEPAATKPKPIAAVTPPRKKPERPLAEAPPAARASKVARSAPTPKPVAAKPQSASKATGKAAKSAAGSKKAWGADPFAD